MTVPFLDADSKLIGAENTLAGYGSVFGNKDRQGDVVDPGAFSKTIKSWQKDGFIAWNHNWAQMIGFPTKAKEDEKGLFFEAEFHSTPDAQIAKTITRERLAAGKTMGLSIGYMTVSDSWEAGARHIKECDLYEVSLVSAPANPLATVSGLKGVVPFQDLPLGDRDAAWDSSAAEKRVREWADAGDAPNARYARAFLWFDSSAAEEFGSYKLPYADVVDGKLTAIPKGIFAAAGAMQGSRGGVDLPDKDMAGVKASLEKWYAKMANAFHDDEISPPWKAFGLPHSGFLAGAIEFASALVEEAGALHQRRTKEGRQLSAANLQKLAAVRASLGDAAGMLDAVLADKGAAGAPSVAELDARYRRLRLAV